MLLIKYKLYLTDNIDPQMSVFLITFYEINTSNDLHSFHQAALCIEICTTFCLICYITPIMLITVAASAGTWCGCVTHPFSPTHRWHPSLAPSPYPRNLWPPLRSTSHWDPVLTSSWTSACTWAWIFSTEMARGFSSEICASLQTPRRNRRCRCSAPRGRSPWGYRKEARLRQRCLEWAPHERRDCHLLLIFLQDHGAQLRSHIWQRARYEADEGSLSLGETEVGQFDPPALGVQQQNVLRLDVTVDQTTLVDEI